MTPRSYPCITNIIRDLVNSIEDRSGIDLPSPGFDPAERFAIESFLIGVLDRYGKVKCNSGASNQSNSNDVDLLSPNTPPSTPVSILFKLSPKESRSTTIDLDTAQTSPASGANSTPAASRGSGAKSKRARAEASRSSSPAKGAHCKAASGLRRPSPRAKSPSLYDSDASEQSQSYVPASSPPNGKKRRYATYASNDSADEAENPDSPQTHKRVHTQESFISSSFTQFSTGEASQQTRETTPPTPN
ncbi:uncharacterized protein K441DRAFT_657502 [Cenococcum geophilum 1.58]|uniref:uncharacterized protein n=1 Tax=Cenococcum geophilum 1.58 TaxID=794803 RepID=UPI00358EC3BD|nr:hypothetical protein K441DRAFT_657502 [Cenococcum geophilum 1.58]